MPKGHETITIVRTERGDKLDPAPTAEQRFDIKGCIIIPRASREQGRGFVQISGYTIFAPPGSDVRPTDQVIARDELYSVEGEPGDFRKGKKRKGLLFQVGRVGT